MSVRAKFQPPSMSRSGWKVWGVRAVGGVEHVATLYNFNSMLELLWVELSWVRVGFWQHVYQAKLSIIFIRFVRGWQGRRWTINNNWIKLNHQEGYVWVIKSSGLTSRNPVCAMLSKFFVCQRFQYCSDRSILSMVLINHRHLGSDLSNKMVTVRYWTSWGWAEPSSEPSTY